MSTITCPNCGNEASAYGSVMNCWCDKMYCDHTDGMFATYSCACGSSGQTPQAWQHQAHQEAKFLAEMARDVSALLATLPNTIKTTFQTESVMPTTRMCRSSSKMAAALLSPLLACIQPPKSSRWPLAISESWLKAVASSGPRWRVLPRLALELHKR